MKQISALVRRNSKLFFKDKGMFFTAMITPCILLVLYATFLGNIYRDTFSQNLPPFVSLSQSVLDGLGGRSADFFLACGILHHRGFLLQYFNGAG